MRHEQHNQQSSPQFPTREYLDKIFNKTDLQKRCRELGITKVWVNKDQLIEIIISKTQPSFQTLHEAQPVIDVQQPLHNDPIPAAVATEATFTRETQLMPGNKAQLPHSENAQPTDTSHDILLSQTPTPDNTQQPSAADDTPQLSIHNAQSSPPCSSQDERNDWGRTQLRNMAKDIETLMSKLVTKDKEVELLNAQVKTAYSLIQLLQQRISDLEQENIRNNRRQDTTSHATIPSKCLLLGDTNTPRVLLSDLNDNCVVKTVTRANIDLLRSCLNEKITYSSVRVWIL